MSRYIGFNHYWPIEKVWNNWIIGIEENNNNIKKKKKKLSVEQKNSST